MYQLLFFIYFLGVTSAYDLGGVISGNRMGSVPLGISLGDGELDVEGICSSAGVACQNCTHAVTCIALPVGWLKVPLTSCSEDQTCNAREGGCSSQTVPECENVTRNYIHKCEQVGIFPDAYDCRKFHLCTPPEDMPTGRPADHRVAMCPRHYGYNPYTAQCSTKLPYGQCEQKPVPECTKIGQSAVLPDSPNHYYVCLSKQGKIYPQIFLCPHGWYFWDGFCRPEPKATNSDVKEEKEIEDKNTNQETVKEQVDEATELTKASTIATSTAFYKITEYPPDTFLADKFDLTNYEAIEETPYVPQWSYEFSSSSGEY